MFQTHASVPVASGPASTQNVDRTLRFFTQKQDSSFSEEKEAKRLLFPSPLSEGFAHHAETSFIPILLFL
jgi:hypothetical protein